MTCQPDGIVGPGGQGSGTDASGLYDRLLEISRFPDIGATAGVVGYRSTVASAETVVLSDLPATIDFTTRGPDPVSKVPSDAVGRTLWRIFVPAGSVSPGAIHRDDIATDDLGRRYKLNEPLWGSIDVQIEAELLRA